MPPLPPGLSTLPATEWLTTLAVPPLAMLVALAVDLRFGEPPPRWHPVVWIGHYLQAAGRRLPAQPPRRAFIAGALAWSLGAAVLFAAATLAEEMLRRWLLPQGPLGALGLALVLGVLLKPMLSWRMLRDEVSAVDAALARSLEAGRAQVARLASRDTRTLGPAEVRETAIETLAENLNDSVVAPLLWFAVAGLPGAVLFRFANTADAMWGYRGRWEWAGKFAARADDVLAWLPARLCAAALRPPGLRWRELAAQARLTPSPNGGWPMAAMALALRVRLGKPGVYALNAAARSPEAADVSRALRHAGRGLRCAVAVLMLLGVAAPAVMPAVGGAVVAAALPRASAPSAPQPAQLPAATRRLAP